MDQLPQPLVIRIEKAEPQSEKPPELPPWRDAASKLRETAKWMAGGVIATAGAVIVGSSLTKIGQLDTPETMWRLGLAGGGLLLGFVAIGLLLHRAVDVLYVASTDIERIANATEAGEWTDLKNDIESEFSLGREGRPDLKEIVTQGTDSQLIEAAKAMAPYVYVRRRFNRLVRWLPATVFGAVVGFGLYAWASNPSNAPSLGEVTVQEDANGVTVTTTKRPLTPSDLRE